LQIRKSGGLDEASGLLIRKSGGLDESSGFQIRNGERRRNDGYKIICWLEQLVGICNHDLNKFSICNAVGAAAE